MGRLESDTVKSSSSSGSPSGVMEKLSVVDCVPADIVAVVRGIAV